MQELESLESRKVAYLVKLKKKILISKNIAGLKMPEIAEIVGVCTVTFRKFMNTPNHCFRDPRKVAVLETWVNRTIHLNEKMNERK